MSTPSKQQQPKKNRKKQQPTVLVLALAAIVVLAVVAVLASRDGGGDDGDADTGVETRPVEVTGAALPPLGEGQDAAVGQTAPTVTGTTLGGEAIAVPGEGPALLIFLAHWCPHCQAEVPVLAEWLEEQGMPAGVDVLAVSTAVDEARGNHPPSAWLAREGWLVPTMADDANGAAAAAFGLTSFPYFVAVDADGVVVARVSGELGVDQVEQLVALARGDGS